MNAPYRFLGHYTVTGGQVALVDDEGSPTNVTTGFVGLQQRCFLRTLPPERINPGAPGMFSSFTVRVFASTRPIINGERPPERQPEVQVDLSPGIDIIHDCVVHPRGWDNNSIDIEEQIPNRCELLGIFGDFKEGGL